MLDLDVPYLPDAKLERAVCELLQKYALWKKSAVQPPIDVDEIVEGYLGLTLEVVDLHSRLGLPDVLGATWFDEHRVAVDQSLEDKEGRFAFTVAHEIGHWQLHRPLHQESKAVLSLFAPQPTQSVGPAVVCRGSEAKAPAEWQADQFAARLLMPQGFVIEAARAVRRGPVAIPHLERDRRAGLLPSAVRDHADRVRDVGGFENVSNEAMSYRLLDLGLVVDEAATANRLL